MAEVEVSFAVQGEIDRMIREQAERANRTDTERKEREELARLKAKYEAPNPPAKDS